MKTMTEIRNIREQRSKDSSIFNKRLDLLAHLAPVLDKIPDEIFSKQLLYPSKIKLVAFYGSHTDLEVRELNAIVRSALHVRRTDKAMGSDGEMVWTTETEDIIAIVYGGDIPANCKLISKEISHTVYTMECK